MQSSELKAAHVMMYVAFFPVLFLSERHYMYVHAWSSTAWVDLHSVIVWLCLWILRVCQGTIAVVSFCFVQPNRCREGSKWRPEILHIACFTCMKIFVTYIKIIILNMFDSCVCACSYRQQNVPCIFSFHFIWLTSTEKVFSFLENEIKCWDFSVIRLSKGRRGEENMCWLGNWT